MTRYYIKALTLGGWVPVGEVTAKDESAAYREALKQMDKLPKEKIRVEKMA